MAGFCLPAIRRPSDVLGESDMKMRFVRSAGLTAEDPTAYVKPFTVNSRARLLPDGDILEYICQENNTSVGRLRGPAGNP